MKVFAYAATALLLLCASPGGAQAPVSGAGQAKDGVSLMVGGTEVRLFGIDAPEFDQYCRRNGQEWSCGSAAADKLAELVTSRNVVCSSVGTDQHGRVLGRCMAGATDVNRTMVASGFAVAFRRYYSDYVSAEESAKVNKRGIWAGTFQMPSDFRHAGDRPAPVPPKTSSKRSAPRAVSSDWQARASGNCKHQGQPQSKGRVDLPFAGHAVLRPDEVRGDLLHRGRGAGGRLPASDCEVAGLSAVRWTASSCTTCKAGRS